MLSVAVRVLIIIAIVLTRALRNTVQHPMCRDEYIFGAGIETGGQAVVYFNVAMLEDEPQVAIKTFYKDCHYETEHAVFSTLTQKQNQAGGDTWFPKLYPSCFMPGKKCLSIVMEFVQKPFVLSRNTRLNERVDILHQLLWAVARLHDMGYTHNDLKESNIRMTDTGVVKLIDFGYARNISKPFGSKTMGGTHIYRAPEAIRRGIELYYSGMPDYNNRPLSPIDTGRLDSWPLGIISFRILTHTSIYDENELLELERCIRDQSYPSDIEPHLIRFGRYFYVKEILMGQTGRSDLEKRLTQDVPIIDKCLNFCSVGAPESRFMSQFRRFTGTEQPGGNLQKDVADLWTVVNGLLQFENSARSDVHDVLKNPIFEKFINQTVMQHRNCLLNDKSTCTWYNRQ